ncbi:MAG: hypothetical protein WBN22_12880 [Verrucomicrobiia bacterium]
MNSLVASLTANQLRRAAALKQQIQSLENRLSRILSPSTNPAPDGDSKNRRKMSAAARRKISLAAKARWARVKRTKSRGRPVQKPKRRMSAAARAKISAAAKARWAKIKTAKG